MTYSHCSSSFLRFVVIALAAVFLAGCMEDGNPFALNDDDSLDSQDESGSSPDEGNVDNTATLSWTPPGHRVNGESLRDGQINSFIISYGQAEDALDQKIVVVYEGNRNMEYVIEDLDDGEWFFAVQTVDHGDLTSPKSAVVSKEI